MKVFLFILFVSIGLSAKAATLYCGPSNTGSGSGADFNNLIALPATTGFTRGNTYIVVDGTYSGRTCSTATSGSSTITIRKASSSHSAVAGYASTLHDGVADFGGMTITTQYWIFDGVTRTESNTWDGPAGYGMAMDSLTSSSFAGDDGDNSQYSYIDFGPTYQTTYSTSWGVVLYFTYQSDISFTRCAIHNGVGTLVQGAGSHNLTFDHCDIGPGWGKEALRGGNGGTASGWVIRYCRFWESSQTDPDDPTSGITAEIGIWDYTGTTSGIKVYGNWFYNSKSGGRNSVIVIGGDGSGWAGDGASGTLVYNNTFAGIAESSVFPMVDLNGSSTEAKNNLFYSCTDTDVSASSTANNVVSSSDPFTAYSSRDYRIISTTGGTYPRNAGADLGSSYNQDPLAVTRGADGTWDVGAYEYDAGGGGGPSPNTARSTRLKGIRLR